MMQHFVGKHTMSSRSVSKTIWFTMANPTHSLAYKALHKQSTLTTGNARLRLHVRLAILDPPVPNPAANPTRNLTPILAIHAVQNQLQFDAEQRKYY